MTRAAPSAQASVVIETQEPATSSAQQVLELMNQERVRQGLPPLKANPQLEAAALGHTHAMADGDFMAHDNPYTGSTPGARAQAAGYEWNAVGENVAAGQPTPAAVMDAWMNSAGHRANILSADFREVGIGYILDAQDAYRCGDVPCTHYWTQLFGARSTSYPVIIDNEAFSTDTISVSLYIYGGGWAQEMRLRNDSDAFTPWEPFATTRAWQLNPVEGERQITVELRNGNNIISNSDTIMLSQVNATRPPDHAPITPAAELPALVQAATAIPQAIQPPVSTSPEALTPGASSNNLLSALCSGFPWWLVLALLLILIFLALVLVRNLTPLRRWLRERRRWPRWCEVTGLLIPVYLLFLLPLILNQFLPLACRPREALYFWRIDNGGTSLVMSKSVNPDLPAQPMQALNRQAGCVACHAVAQSGSRIAAVENGANGPVVVMGLDGKPVPIPPINASFLSWSPDGAKLAYSAGDQDIYILDLSTGTATPLSGASDPNVVETMPAWSHDGRTIAFVRPVSGDEGFQISVPTDIYTVPATGGAPTLLAGASGDGFNYYPSFSPDGKWLAFTRHIQGNGTYADNNAEIYTVPAQGGPPRRLVANDAPGGQTLSQVSNSWPTWSRDGSLLAFNSKRNGGQYDIFLTRINPDGSSGPAEPLVGANDPTAFEHLPFWGEPPQPDVWAGLIGLWPWLLPIPLMVALAWSCCRRPAPPPPSLRLEGKVSPSRGRLNRDEFGVQLRLIGDIRACRDVHTHKPVDAALVIDVSGSMAESLGVSFTGSKLDGAKRAAKTFVDKLDLEQDQVTVISFSDDAQVALALENDSHQIKRAIDRLSTLGGTSIHAGLDVALQSLTGAARRDDAEPAIILLSDGGSDPAPAEEVATRARDAGVRVITIGLGAGANQALLQSLASQPSDYHFSPDAGGLTHIYRSIAESIRQPVAATEVEFEHRFDAANFVLVPGSVAPTPHYIGDGVLIWNLNHIGTAPRSFRYRLRPRNPGAFNIDQGNQIDYLNCGEALSTLRPTVNLPVMVTERKKLIVPPKPKAPPEPPVVRPPDVIWQPDQALVIGVGGTGRWVLTHLQKNLRDAGAGRLPDQVRTLVIDTSEYELINNQQVPVEFAGARIEPTEVVVLNQNLGPLIARMARDADVAPELRTWFPDGDYRGLGDSQKDLARGTQGRRPLARAGLMLEMQQEAHQQEEGDGSQLWRLLTEAVSQVKGEHGIRVILVGSLAGGMSGVLFDVAYLARRAALAIHGENTSVIIGAYLALDSIFNGLTTVANPAGLAANTFAALRELRRFQLNPGVAYPMRYASQTNMPALAGDCDRRLFDDVFLFGERVALGTDPRTSTFPAIADLITLDLDRASQRAGTTDWNVGMRNNVDRYRQTQHDLAVGTAGSFVYRLPAYDMMEDIKTRWVRALIEAFLIGDDHGVLRLDPTLVRDPGLISLSQDPAALVPLFMEGGMRDDPPNRGLEGAAALASLITGHPDEQLEIGLQEVERQSEQQVRQAFEAELAYTLQWILLGTEQAELSQSRVGKLGYALAFLDALAVILAEAEATVEHLANNPQFDAQRQRQARHLQTVRAIYQVTVEGFRSKLRGVGRAISRTALRDPGGPDGLYDALENQASHLKDRRHDMDTIRVRQYMWTVREQVGPNQYVENELADCWYGEYASGNNSPTHYVEHLAWEVHGDGQVLLVLRMQADGQPIRKTLQSLDDVPDFMKALLTMAGSILQGAWGANDLSSVMASHGILEGRADVADHIRKSSEPVLTFDPNLAAQALGPHIDAAPSLRRAVLGATQRFQKQASDLWDALQTPQLHTLAPTTEPTTMLETTDRFACQFIRTVNLIPLEAIERLIRGIGGPSAQDHYLRDHQRRVVFPAEVEAEAWERHRRVDDGMRALILHPLVVAGLAVPERARCYALALAGGIILQNNDDSITIRLPGQAGRQLLKRAPQGVDPLVMGLLEFALHAPADLVQPIQQIVDQPEQGLNARWRSLWAAGIPKDFQQGPEDRRDLGRLVRLVVRNELAQRSQP